MKLTPIKNLLFSLLIFLSSIPSFGAADPNKVFQLTNQYGEKSINYIGSNGLPLLHDVVYFSGATTPVDGVSGTGAGFAGPGSIYAARDTGAVYLNSNTKASPTWSSAGSTTNGAIIAATLTGFSSGAGTISSSDTILTAINKLSGDLQNKTVLANVLTAFSAGAGTVSSSDTVLQGLQKLQGNDAALKNGTFTPAPETVSSAGALSTSLMESIVSNAGTTFAVTLAAPSSQDGQIKIIKMGTATGTVTLAMTNIVISGGFTGAGTTTLTFTNTGDSAVFIAVGSKWVYLGGSAVAS